ncbi:MAG: uroporphyrinogen-III synthase [Erythrobacter sp.]|jgi:uroporphyrinogen-III synthase|nr:uroporphyrinogen-III synthase [Erythrobacter sp.]
MSARAHPLILAIRPEPGLAATLAQGRRHGLAITGVPLFEIRPRGWDAPDPARIDGLLIGSANAIRHGGTGLAAFIDKPVFAVGAATADAARKAGFEVAAVGEGGLQGVLAAIAPPRRLLRIAGEEHVALDPPEGVGIETVIAYESAALPLSPELGAQLAKGAIVLLHSATAAAHFAAECGALGVPRAAITLAALGPRIASAAGKDWRAIHMPDRPRDAALLALVAKLCL